LTRRDDFARRRHWFVIETCRDILSMTFRPITNSQQVTNPYNPFFRLSETLWTKTRRRRSICTGTKNCCLTAWWMWRCFPRTRTSWGTFWNPATAVPFTLFVSYSCWSAYFYKWDDTVIVTQMNIIVNTTTIPTPYSRVR